MVVPPRRRDARLFDRTVVVRGALQGLGLLCLLLATYGAVLAATDSHDMARALTFTALVLSNLGLIHSNRRWGRTPWSIGSTWNAFFGWISAATVALLALVLGVPAVSRLFAFALPPVMLWLVAMGVVATAMVWFELVKWWPGRPRALVR